MGVSRKRRGKRGRVGRVTAETARPRAKTHKAHKARKATTKPTRSTTTARTEQRRITTTGWSTRPGHKKLGKRAAPTRSTRTTAAESTRTAAKSGTRPGTRVVGAGAAGVGAVGAAAAASAAAAKRPAHLALVAASGSIVAAPPAPPIVVNERPEVILTSELKDNVEETIRALDADKDLYSRGGTLVKVVAVTTSYDASSKLEARPKDSLTRPEIAAGEVVDDGEGDVLVPKSGELVLPEIWALSPAVLAAHLTGVIRFRKMGKPRKVTVLDDKVDPPVAVTRMLPPLAEPTLPNQTLVHAVRDWGTWPTVRPLVAVSEAPFLRRDGTLVQNPGYDGATGVLYTPNAKFLPVKDKPSRHDAKRAWGRLIKLLCDFPHDDDVRTRDGRLRKPGAHKALVWAAAMTILVRAAIAGAVPGFLFDANTRGSGKTLQTDLITMAVCGRMASRMTYADDDAEIDKTLAGYADNGRAYIAFDNIDKGFGGAPIDKVLTASDTVEFRRLKTNTNVQKPWRAVILGTGNNIHVKGDTVRRVLKSRLVSPEVRPELRTNFQIKDLLRHVRAHRPHIVRDMLTVLRAYFVAGRPDMKCGEWGSFTGWARLIPPAIVFAGGPNTLACRPGAEDDSTGLVGCMAVVLLYMRSRNPWTANELIHELWPDDYATMPRDAKSDEVRDAIEQLCGQPKYKTGRYLGFKLRDFKDRVFEVEGLKLKIESRPGRSGVGRWQVAEAGRDVRVRRGTFED